MSDSNIRMRQVSGPRLRPCDSQGVTSARGSAGCSTAWSLYDRRALPSGGHGGPVVAAVPHRKRGHQSTNVNRIRALLQYLVGGPTRNEPSREPAVAAVVSADPEEVAREYAATLLGEARDELTRADNKASLLLAAAGVAAGAVAAGMVSSGWTPERLQFPWSLAWFTGAVFGLAGIATLVVAVYPRTKRGRDDEAELFYFGHAARIKTPEDLAAELKRSSEHTFERSADQLWRVSQVVATKYALVRVAIWLLGLGALATLSSSIANNPPF
jgi:pycsar effector protein